MSMKRNVPTLLAVAGLAYAAGHFGLFTGGASVAFPPPGEEEITPEMQAWHDAATPGEHHQYLDPLAGEWDTEFKIWMETGAEPMMSRGTVERKWILGGRFIKERVEATSDMGTFNGLGFIGYNNTDGQYQIAWMDDHSTGIVVDTGVYDAEKKVLKFRGTHRDPYTGRVINTRSKVDLSDPNRQTYAGYMTGPDGKSFKSFEGVAQRKQ